MGVNNSLLKSIQTIIDKAIEIAPFDKTRQAQIITNNGDGSYTVRLDGILYNNVPSYPKTNIIEVGTIVKVMIPANQSSQMYIQSSKGGGGGDHVELTQAEYDALTPEEQTDGTVYFISDGDPIPRAMLDFFYPVGTCYETKDSNFNPNTSWGGTWTKIAESVVVDITKRQVQGSINKQRGYSTSITAPTVDGYEFDFWGQIATSGWVSSLYVEYAASTTSNVWNTVTDGSGQGTFYIYAHYVKKESVYRWTRTA